MYKLGWFWMYIFLTGSFLWAQDSTALKPDKAPVVQYDSTEGLQPLSLDRDMLERYKGDTDYQYIEITAEDNWWTRFKRWVSRWWNQFLRWLFGGEVSGFWAVLVRALPYLIIAGIVIFVIWLFYKLNPGTKFFTPKEKPEVFFTEEEEIIRSKDIKKLIAQALEQKDYRGAVRYYYLFILKELSERELIDYEFDKTNADYLQELIATQLKQGFQRVTKLYDYIWYGNFSVTESDYRKAESTFVQLEKNIQSHHD
tara:strand:+ start:4191 stop:4955 length:765 start_codon:yes stop_codon:yes gene_type:complete